MVIAQACNAQKQFKLIPKHELKTMFSARFKPFDIISAQGQKLSPGNYKLLKQLVNYFLKNETITFLEYGKEINLYDYYYVGDFLRVAINDFKDEQFKGASEIAEAFKPLLDKHDAPDGPHNKLFEISNLMAGLLSHINKGYWLFHYHLISRLDPSPEFRTCFKVEYVPPKRMDIIENGFKRPAFRVGWTVFGQKVKWAQVTPLQLNLKNSFSGLKMDVYIQSHALLRMKERLDCFTENIRHFILYQSIDLCETNTNNRGQSLITYKLGKTKLGYLVYEYNQGVVLIKTFLFLTNNDTPEGEKLNQLLGLEKLDKQYLNLDKLSQFVNSDIPGNQKLYILFKDAGCADLFEINDIITKQNIHHNIHAGLIEKYIKSIDI